MEKKDFKFLVQANSVKGLSSSLWHSATVSIDEEGRKIHIIFDKTKPPATQKQISGTQVSENLARNESNSSGSSDGVGKSVIINLADCKAPKRKKNFPPPNHVVEVSSRWLQVVKRSAYQFCTREEEESIEFFKILRRINDTSAQRRPSVSSISSPGEASRPPQRQQAELPPTRPGGLAPVYSTLGDGGGGSDYATVEGGEVFYDAKSEIFYVESEVYEQFDSNRCFSVQLDSYEGWSEAPSRLGFCVGDKALLYLSDTGLELLTADLHKRLLCSWPFTHIKCFGHRTDYCHLEFGPRSCTGLATLKFSFATHDRAAKLAFVDDLTAYLKGVRQTPNARQVLGCGHCRRCAVSRSSSDADDLDGGDLDPTTGNGVAEEADEGDYEVTVPDVYDTVKQPQAEQKPQQQPVVPPHPTNIEPSSQQRRPSVPAAAPLRPTGPPPPRPVAPPPPPPPSTSPSSAVQTPPPIPPPPVTLPPSTQTLRQFTQSPPPTLPKPPLERRHLSTPIPTSPTSSSGPTQPPGSATLRPVELAEPGEAAGDAGH